MSNYHNKTKIISIISFGIFFGLYNLSVGFNLNDEISSMIKKFNNGDISKRYQDTFYSAKLPEDPYGEAIKSIEQQSMQEKIAGTEHIEKALAEKNCSLSQKKIWAILYYYVPEFKSDLARSLKKELGDTSSKNFIMDHDKVMDYCYDYYNCLILSEESRSERTKISYYTPRDVETNCKEFFQENYRRGQGNEERQQNIQTTQLGYDKYRNSTTEDSPYDIMSDIGNIGKLLYEEVEEPITPVSYRLPVFSNSANALQQRKKNNDKPVNSGEQKNNPGTTGDNDQKEDFTDEDEDKTQQLTGKALEIEKARETLNIIPIEESLEEYDVTVNVKADEGTFPKGTRLVIKAIKGNALEEVKQQISEDPSNNVDENSEIIAFDIKFLYKLSDGTEIEVQPKDGESVQVTFDYSNNTNFKTAYEYGTQGIEIFHINNKDRNGEKVAEGTEVVEKVNINEEKSEKIDNALVIDAENFSIYAATVNNNKLNGITIFFNTNGGKNPSNIRSILFRPHSNDVYTGVFLTGSLDLYQNHIRGNVYRDNGIAYSYTFILSLYDIEKYLIPNRSGYEFIGWYSDKNLTNKFDYDTILTQDITLYARWAKNISHSTVDGVKTLTIHDSFSNKSITIMESNLGSKSKKDGYQIPWTIGYLYQWGNNYGFTEKQIKTESRTPIKYKNYGPKNPYESSKYTVLLNPAYNSPDYGKYDNTDYWENGAHYPNLRGGKTDSKSNNRGLDNISSTATNRQGPCPEGFHIPSKGEWDELLDIWSKNNDVTRRKTQFYEGPRGRETWPDHNPSNKISKDLNLWPESEHECLWTSSPEEKIKGNSYTFKKGYYYTPTTTNISNSVACQIRCFLNPSTSKSDKLEINLGSNLKQLASDIKNFNGEPTPQPAEGPTEEPTIPQPSLEPQPINNNTEPKMQGLNNYIQNGLLGSTNKTYYGNSCEESNKESTEDYLEEFFNSDSPDSPNSSNEDFELTDEEYEDLIEYMQGAIDDYLSLTDEQKKEISKNVGNHNNQINSTTPSELEDTANQIKNCFQSCNGLRFDQKASCMMMCACGEINSPIFDPSKTPGLGPILMIRFCTIPGVNHNFSVGGRKIMSIEEGIREIFGVVDKLSREGRLGIWTQQHNFLDSTTKKTKISDTVAFTISVEFADVGDYKPKQSTQYKEKKAEDRNKTLQAAYHISNNLEDPVQKNRYRLINDNSSTTNDFSSITNIGTNKEKNSKLSTSSYTSINQNANADASRYNDTSESLHRRIDQQGHLWNEISKYINELDKEAQMLYAKKRI